MSLLTNPVRSKGPPGLNNWLRDWGAKYGWNEISGTNADREVEAQEFADQGKLVVFTVKTGDGSVEPTGGEGHSGVVAPQGSRRNQKFKESERIGRRFVRSQAGEVQLRQARVGAAHGEQPTNIFVGHFDAGFWVYEQSEDKSRGKPVIDGFNRS
ncbi:hypothetical protein ENSA5_35670 [Enhygromyxa salina]|uniref:Uncharacterized protein n=1 Tax=Enhygromyxa salina TaxID=215803 RepID=A0A2S9XVC2_9BACT|nr:hypothetical protein [Enhygromyxa salina]PRP96793.1 hypothetical protein ENSA5_35670 [Enhygromyxa salina]